MKIEELGTNIISFQVQLILEKAKQSTQNRYCQKIFCGEKWTENVEILAKNYLENFFLVIGSYAEAAIYSKLRPSIYLVKAQHKPEFVMGVFLKFLFAFTTSRC